MTGIDYLKQALINNPSLRWGSSFALVVCLYAGAIVTALYWSIGSSTSPAPPMAAMMIELAPMPVAPETPPNAAPPGPVQEETPPPPPEPMPELPVIKEAEAVLPPKPEPIEEALEPEPIEEQMAQEDKAPPAFEAPPDKVAAAPAEGAVSLAPSRAPATWQSVLLGHLERHKRYPRESRRNRQEATTYVRIKINRDGTVVDYSLEKPCAYQALNQETLALIARAQPLPPPPIELAGNTIEFVVPVEFFLTR